MKQWLIHGGVFKVLDADLVLLLTADEFRTLRHTLESSSPRTARIHTKNGFKVTLREANVSGPILIRTEDHYELLIDSGQDLVHRIAPLCDDADPVDHVHIDLDNEDLTSFVLERDLPEARSAP